MIKNALAVIGLLIVLLAVAGNLGIGSFRLYYGPDQVACFNMQTGMKLPKL